MIELLGPTSTSELSTLLCPRKFMYRYVRNWQPKTLGTALATGIFFHKCAADGYKHLREGGREWLRHAFAATHDEKSMIDRDGIPLGLDGDQIQATRDMLQYFWENSGRFDEFKEILIIDEERYFEFAGWKLRITIDLAYFAHDGRFILLDHKTSGDIANDLAFLPLDLQTHLYYYGANALLERRPDEFIHNFVRRFDFAGTQMTGPPSWERMDGTKPYLHTKSGKIATRSDDVNDYLRRSRTPLQAAQLKAFESELRDQLAVMRYHQVSGVYPRRAQKGNMGCSNCDYYAPCTTEMDGREVNMSAMAMKYTMPTVLP